MGVPIYSPANNVEGSLFATSSPVLIVCRFFDDGHSDQCEVVPHLICISLITSDVEHLFICMKRYMPFWSCVCLLWTNVC